MTRPPCPECLPGAAAPHDRPDEAHAHVTGYGYVIYDPDRQLPAVLDQIRCAGREDGARAIAEAIDAMDIGAYAFEAADVARRDQTEPTGTESDDRGPN